MKKGGAGPLLPFILIILYLSSIAPVACGISFLIHNKYRVQSVYFPFSRIHVQRLSDLCIEYKINTIRSKHRID